MKQLILSGFALVAILSDGTVKNLQTGKISKPNKKGEVTLTCSEAAGDFKEGEKYTFVMESLLAMEGFEDVPAETPATEEAPKELTENEIFAARTKELKKALDMAKNSLLSAKTKEDTFAAKDMFDASLAALEAHQNSKKKTEVLPTDEEAETLAAYDAAVIDRDNANTFIKSLVEQHSEVIKKFRKAGKKSASGEASNRAPKGLTKDDCQNIRRDYMVGRENGTEGTQSTIREIAEKYGVTPQQVKYIVNYQQHQISKDEEAITPLVNEHFPAAWVDSKGNDRSGAPFIEDGVKLTYDERYKKIPAKA